MSNYWPQGTQDHTLGLRTSALRDALDRLTSSRLERKHRQGYERRPGRKGEFDTWEKEQEWPDL